MIRLGSAAALLVKIKALLIAADIRCGERTDRLPARQLYGWGGMTLFEERFLGVVRAKFRTKVVAGGRSPKLYETVATTERLAAEHAVGRAAVREIPAAREHRTLSAE